MDYKKYLCPAGAEALRTLSASMPIAIENINEDTEALNAVYQSVSSELGDLENEFGDMVKLIESAQKQASDAIMELPARLNQTAQKIDDWCKHSNVNGGN